MIILGLLTAAFIANGQNLEVIHLIPKQGIVLNSDSILKDRITIENLCKLLKIRYNSDTIIENIEFRDWINEKTGLRGGDCIFFEEVQYKSIVFKFVSSNYNDEKILSYINILDPNEFNIFTNDGNSLSGSNPRIQEFFPFVNEFDNISSDKLTINLNTYGMCIHIMRLKNDDYRISSLSIELK